MHRLFGCKRPPRNLAALIAFAYLWLGCLGEFQHNHHLFAHEAEAMLQVVHASASEIWHAPLRTAIHAQTQAPLAAHCAVCEWQAANVSQALPAFAIAFLPPQAPRAITTFPRYLGADAFPTPSRGPPAV